MCGQKPETTKKRICLGLLAHVDAGKTTLAEGILYHCRAVRNLGRVDRKDTALDNHALERTRGITIFSKQARIEWEGMEISLLDTPGHVDFSAEMERTLQVLDYAVLVISGSDGLQSHVQTLWRLLKRYRVPVFLFINKMDMPGADKEGLLQELQKELDEGCIDFSQREGDRERFCENLSLCAEELLDEFLETGGLSEKTIAGAIAKRQIFPCYFGSALRLEGVKELLLGLKSYTAAPEYGEEFGARVFKIARDASGARLTWMKITGGRLRVKMPVPGRGREGEFFEEKAEQLRFYTGGAYKTAETAEAGSVCAVTGLTKTFAGQGLGAEGEAVLPALEPVLTYRVLLPKEADPVQSLLKFRQLEEEDPQLNLVWKESLGEIHVQVMGDIQLEILKSIIRERFGMAVEFDTGSIVYKETIAEPVVGIGHFEPLRHYAEVHLLLEPGEAGSGLQFDTRCSEDLLAGNWQRLVLGQLEEKRHIGVLTGSELTDMRITLLAGKAHPKHTEGGDFRQAACRAVRQGLRRGKSVLLEPYFEFTLTTPKESIGRAMSDIRRKNGSFDSPVAEGEYLILTGTAPVSSMQDYQKEVTAYTGGRGRLSCTLSGYRACHNPEEVAEAIGYDCDRDVDNPADSVFCAHGAGYVVSWEQAEDCAHVENKWKGCKEAGQNENQPEGQRGTEAAGRVQKVSLQSGERAISQEEIEEIFRQTYGCKKEDEHRYRRYHRRERRREQDFAEGRAATVCRTEEKYLLVDGYNIIFSWEDLKELSAINMDSARDRLTDILSDYQSIVGDTLILVFDAYKVKGNPGFVQKYHNIYVVYTREAETADQYIEKTVHKIGRKNHVTVATSDGLEQMIIWGDGAFRQSAKGLREAIEQAKKEFEQQYLKQSF